MILNTFPFPVVMQQPEIDIGTKTETPNDVSLEKASFLASMSVGEARRGGGSHKGIDILTGDW